MVFWGKMTLFIWASNQERSGDKQGGQYAGKITVTETEWISTLQRQNTQFCLWFKFKFTAKGHMMQQVMWAVSTAPKGQSLFSMN